MALSAHTPLPLRGKLQTMRISLKLPEGSEWPLECLSWASCGDVSHFPWLRFKLTAVGPTKPNYEGLRLGIRCGVETFSSPWAHKYLNNARDLAELASTDTAHGPTGSNAGGTGRKQTGNALLFCARALFLAHLLGC